MICSIPHPEKWNTTFSILFTPPPLPKKPKKQKQNPTKSTSVKHNPDVLTIQWTYLIFTMKTELEINRESMLLPGLFVLAYPDLVQRTCIPQINIV